MDNVACFGSEAKLINCSYHSDTSEDDHSTDVLVHCALESETTTVDTARQESAITVSVVSLSVALIICVVVVLFGMVYIIHKRQEYKKHLSTTKRQVKKSFA